MVLVRFASANISRARIERPFSVWEEGETGPRADAFRPVKIPFSPTGPLATMFTRA